MAIAPLILKGNLTVGGTLVSGEVTAFKIKAAAETVDVPATLDSPKGHRGGSASYELEIGYLSTDGTDGVLFNKLWTALGTASKEVTFSGNMRDDTPGAANPTWSGTFIVTEASLGGDAEDISVGSATFPLIAKPTRTP